MADRYRKPDKSRVTINCKVTAEAKAYLDQLAGEFAIGVAIEQLVESHRKRREEFWKRNTGPADAIPTTMH